jgi:hypothetical protein
MEFLEDMSLVAKELLLPPRPNLMQDGMEEDSIFYGAG